MRYRTTIIGLLILLSTIVAQGQIKIGGNVYGGGNHAEVKGSTKVTVKAGDIGAVIDPADERPENDPQGRVFGGARMANVGGNTYVHIDGKSDVATGTPNYIVINHVYGGNDIAGRIGTAKAVGEALPTELVGNPDLVDNTYNSYVHLSTKLKDDDSGDPATDAKKIFIGQLFAGGNGNFDYEQTPGPDDGKVTHTIYNKSDKDHTTPLAELVTDEGEEGFHLPELEKAYLDIQGGTIFFAYGGGNNATVKEKTVIHVDNPSAVVTDVKVGANGQLAENGTDLLTDSRVMNGMGIRLAQEHIDSPEFQIGRLFGGNNLAEMTIRPTWNLQVGKIRNLYSGGNRGAMTSPEGLLLEIDPLSTNKHPLIVDNVYGGCRMADVMPAVNGVYTPCPNLQDKDEHGDLKYSFPNELSARVLVRGGDINNVYGGNDVAGKVYGGDAVGIYTTVRGDVYGGGNGSYAYTDNDNNKDDDTYGDFYYQSGNDPIDDLNAFRPNAEQVSIRLKGTDAGHPTIIKGSVYLGGNCASLASLVARPDTLVELKIGSHVIADKVFLGNNGEKMIDPDILTLYNSTYCSFQLTDDVNFANYMNGVAMPLRPDIVFDDDYIDKSSYIGSFYCGGNKGSMTASGKTSLKFNKGLIIFEKIVGGCNDANVEAGEKNAAYEGGVLGSSDEQKNYTEGGKIKDRIELSLDNVLIEPKRWDDTFAEITADDIEDGKLKAGEEYYTTNLRSSRFIAKGTEDATIGATDKYYKLKTKGSTLEWNTAKWDTNENDFVKTGIGPDGTDDEKRRLLGGNVYGGCYNSGHINGNVVINLNQDLLKRDEIFAEADPDNPYLVSGTRNSGVLKEAQGDDVMAVAMTLFGGGYGENSEVWGSATVNLNNGYVFQVFGGGEEGIIGKKNSAGVYVYDAAYSTTVNLKGPNAGYAEGASGLPLAEAEYIYGGGSEGDVCGDSYVYLGNGRVYDAFGGASNADTYGASEVYIGHNGGFPWIRNNVYGGNDFGGTVRGMKNHIMAITRPAFDSELLKSSTYVKYIQGRVDTIFGGNYGYYDYADRIYKDYTDAEGTPLKDEGGNPIFSFPHLNDNSFVHFEPVDNANNQVNYIFGGSAGFPGNVNLNDAMQKEAYVLIDDTKTKEEDRFEQTDIYGGGSFAGVGTSTSTSTSLGAGRTAVDLFAGKFNNVYGGCNREGLVGYTRVNVPSGSTVKVNALFGGSKGYEPAMFDIPATAVLAERYCDNYVTCIDYKSKNAIVEDAIYGGNQNCRISADTYINIEAPVMQSSGYQATIYGAGYGKKTVSGRTNVFMNNGSNAYKVFGGGRDGNAFNYVSLIPWLTKQFRIAVGNDDADVSTKVDAYGGILRSFATYLTSNPITLPNHTGTYVNSSGEYDGTYTNDILSGDFHQTNVHIMRGGNVSGYAYGGGLGTDAVVAGTTYIELKGGNVDKDIYGGGQGGSVFDEFNLGTSVFTATTNVNIEGGMARNVYGGGYLGHVGKHTGAISDANTGDIPAVANVTIGKADGTTFYNGVPAIMRNVYGGGEGGSVYGTANLTINNGYVGYRYKGNKYIEELDDQKPNEIEKAGNAFGGGYVVNSYVDNTNVKMYGGTLRGSLYGGGEIGPIGRGTMKDNASGGISNGKATIYKAGKTHVELYDGHVMRNVFGGGRGYDSWGGDGTKFMQQNMTQEEFANLDLKCKGYVFGQTEVDIFGGEVGTDEGVAQGYGNVFGGGDIGCVYSAYENESGVLSIGHKNGTRYDGEDNKEGYYYKFENGSFKKSGNEYFLTEDCKVLVEPWCKATSSVTINGTTYTAGTFVPTSALNYLGNKNDTKWASLGKTDVNKEGVIIHNAVFAGGNTSPASTEVYANTTTVFGNATASIHDVYHRDLISIGRGRVGGLYGDGNLTLVDGYRELNITNYGTDYYHIDPEITLAQYDALPDREAAYYEIRYKCVTPCTDKNGKNYAVGSTITADEMVTVFEGVKVNGVSMIQADGKPLETYWKENGVCSRYAGRPMNTLQRADFCGVFGSRMVMQGAQDRVPETVDYTNYTINRVREVSLNKKDSKIASDLAIPENNSEYYKHHTHGNYFGIYSVVNFLGALTSDVDFGDEDVRTNKRTSDNSDTDTYQATANGQTYGNASFYDWKKQFHEERRRNNGNSHNKLALASGVYLELTSEKSSGKGLNEKDWGYITGVVELDLINVQPGMGGGYVYAKNEHGTRQNTNKNQTILTALNTGAVTNKKFSYVNTAVSNQKEWETSGNFVHSTQTIIDDCYNIGGKYKVGESPVPAHYWFIKGAVYIYDQYISAYTGSPNAFSETVSIPLTITSASHGKMTLLNVQPNYYAYYSVNAGSKKTKLGENDKIVIREKEYGLNDAITYWDYSQLTAAEKNLFVGETYVVIADCTLGGTTYKAGTVLLPSEYTSLKNLAPKKDLDDDENTPDVPSVHHVSRNDDVDFDYVFRPSNNVSHNTGYILTYDIDNPNQWNTWYTPKVGTSLTDKKDSEQIKTLTKSDYENGPTYTPITTGMYGQNDYKVGRIISKEEYTMYGTAYGKLNDSQKAALGTQAVFYPAWIVTADNLETTKGSGTTAVPQHLHKGATLAKEDYTPANWATMTGSVAQAYVVTKTIQLSNTEFVYRNTYLTADSISALKTAHTGLATEIDNSVEPAYYCSSAGRYGGNYYETGKNYRALAAFTAMSKDDRENFTYNYDALDLLIDPTYSRAEGVKYQYDGNYTSAEQVKNSTTGNKATYSLATSIDYSATYKGSESLTYIADDNSSKTATNGTELSRTEYERLPNEQYYWAPIKVVSTSDTYYVVMQTIVLGDTPYAAGQVISQETYGGLGDSDRNKVAKLTFTSAGDYYYCREAYTIPNNADGHAVTSASGVTGSTSGTYNKNTEVPTGVVITDETYTGLTNKQKNFSIHGLAPTETSALYVTGGSDIFDLSAEKIITVIYQYDYVESDLAGTHITPVSERHVLNIHLNFKSGVPTVEDIQQPDIVLPGTTVSIAEPYVTPGAYEITGGGWKLFDTESDAESHINGVEYTPSDDPLYLYQNKHYLAYYAKTYLGETFSNHVPVSVANYHDLKKVMNDKEHHYYIDHQEIYNRLKVEPKIYINDYSKDAEGSKNGLDLFKDLYDLSLLTNGSSGVAGGKVTTAGSLKDHALLNTTRVGAGKNLEFFLRTDINHPASWTSIASGSDPCFDGTLHGDGHTISGLNNSLFGKLCGEVYNLGVTGSFTGAGVVDTGDGYVENCWINTTGTPNGTVYAVFGNPSATDAESKQIVNSYYQGTKNYLTTTSSHGNATPKSDRAFYNGEVAYDLNNFYLYKRYSDHKVTTGNENQKYSYFAIGNDGKVTLVNDHFYPAHADLCSTGHVDNLSNVIMYVEDRFADGDFRYAAGEIPTSEDERFYSWTDTDPDTDEPVEKSSFFPIWPDDYIFFGQKLNYGYAVVPHQNVPTAVVRNSSGRLSDGDDANRVYRAPAYYGSKAMGVAHFNPSAYLAQKSSDGTKDAYPGMTAIDFAGHNDVTYTLGANGSLFYQPLLDDDGLTSIVNKDETKNLLVYAPSADANAKTYDVLSKYFEDPKYSDYYNVDNPDRYRAVADATSATSSIYGHLVQGNLTATNDHLLVEKQDFNCPIAYNFDNDPNNPTRMWYQRKPEDQEYVDLAKGWQGISIPFTAEIVTTNDKGEITHFYSGSEERQENTKGHEYWLREFNGATEETVDETIVAKGTFHYPTATADDKTKTFTNTFLWDYYYKNEYVHNQQDKNNDIYLDYRKYYNGDHDYANYPLLKAATPYIIGLPNETYYEFDLSGKWEAENTKGWPGVSIPKIDKQTITFASNAGAVIKVSDDENTDVTKSSNDNHFTFTFHRNYRTQNLGTTAYVLSADGSRYDKVTAEGGSAVSGGATTIPFRPYFTASSTANHSRKMMPAYIYFGNDYNGLEEGPTPTFDGALEIYAKDHKIITTSHLREPVNISIVNVGGITFASYMLQPGETQETRVNNAGVYIVNRKKLLVR